MTDTKDRTRLIQESFTTAITEALFVFLPLIVLTITLAIKSNLLGIFSQAEWAFASSVLAGQSILQFVLAFRYAANKRTITNYGILIVACIIVLLLVPSLVILAGMLLLDNPPVFLVILQIILFALSLAVFIFSRTTSEVVKLE